MTEAEQFRAALVPKVTQAIWAELEDQNKPTYDRDMTGVPYADINQQRGWISGYVNMPELANAAIDTVLAAFSPPF